MSDYTGKESYTVAVLCDNELLQKVRMVASPSGLNSGASDSNHYHLLVNLGADWCCGWA